MTAEVRLDDVDPVTREGDGWRYRFRVFRGGESVGAIDLLVPSSWEWASRWSLLPGEDRNAMLLRKAREYIDRNGIAAASLARVVFDEPPPWA